MKALVLMLGAALIGCTADTTKLNEKMDKIDKKLDAILAQGGRGGAAPQRPQRHEPDRSKTYAVPIAGNYFDGPADAKITVVKAYEYACPYCERVRGTIAPMRGPSMPPEEQVITSMPRAFSSRASATVSSSVHAPPLPSIAETRKKSGRSCGHAARTASAISSPNRMRPARSPP